MTIKKILRGSYAIFDSLNSLRNNNSPAHPSEFMIDANSARFAIDISLATTKYILLLFPVFIN